LSAERVPDERQIRSLGGELAAAFPSVARHPLRALDARAMDLAARDQELRAALFRFVDVVPACRSVDDVARHLTAFLDEVPQAPAAVTAHGKHQPLQ
jgi:RHH-type proline utilization regulon transcriptional repressor/proline dehydrogenase/delta 1-pyrroline-5-carboxylate dehydrogenase